MKVFLTIVLCALVSLCCAEPQRYRSGRLRSRVLARQEVLPSEDTVTAPYPASGWRPEGATLELPSEQTESVVPDYAPPATEYGSPAIVFTPEAAEEAAAEEPEAVEPLADEPEAEEFDPEAGAILPVSKSGRLRSYRRAQLTPQRAPAKLRRARYNSRT